MYKSKHLNIKWYTKQNLDTPSKGLNQSSVDQNETECTSVPNIDSNNIIASNNSHSEISISQNMSA